jgi:hypothetical protein
VPVGGKLVVCSRVRRARRSQNEASRADTAGVEQVSLVLLAASREEMQKLQDARSATLGRAEAKEGVSVAGAASGHKARIPVCVWGRVVPTPGGRNRLDGYSKRGKERALIADRRFNRLVARRPGHTCKIHIREIRKLRGWRAK